MPRYRTMQDAVEEFQTAFNRPKGLKFSDVETSRSVANTFGLRQALIQEEFYELVEAMNEKNEQNIKKDRKSVV